MLGTGISAGAVVQSSVSKFVTKDFYSHLAFTKVPGCLNYAKVHSILGVKLDASRSHIDFLSLFELSNISLQ